MLYVGLDHSLTAFGLAAACSDWEQEFLRVRRVTLETGPNLSLVARREKLAADVVEWVRWQAEREFAVPLSQTKVFIEGGIFNAKNANTIRSQERLAAVVEHELWKELKIETQIVEQRHARSIFMGKSLSGGRGAGEAAQELLKALLPNAHDWDEAELDAMIVLNAALYDAGEAFVSCAPDTSKGAA